MAIVADTVLKELLNSFPAKYCYAFAYGSAVFVQKNQQPGKMTDLVFVVDDPLVWHTANLQMNPRHYSSLRFFGPRLISTLQERMACGVYYNPYCKIDGKVVKYGVISTASLENDLRLWKHIYIAGRLHKPVVDVFPPSKTSLVESIKKNRQTALRTALLQRGRIMSKFELFHSIAEISYLGDTRMRFAEHPDKTKNIVTPLMPEFDRIYSPLLNEIPSLAVTSDGMIAQDISPTARYKNLIALPIPIQISLVKANFKDPRFVDVEQVLADLSYLPNLNFFIRKAIGEVVRGSSILQTVQGFFSAGVIRSTIYALDKLRKGAAAKKTTPILPLPSPQMKVSNESGPVSVSKTKSTHTVPPQILSPDANNGNEKLDNNSNFENDTLSSALSAFVPVTSDSESTDSDNSLKSHTGTSSSDSSSRSNTDKIHSSKYENKMYSNKTNPVTITNDDKSKGQELKK